MCFEAFCLLVAQLGQVALTETIHLLANRWQWINHMLLSIYLVYLVRNRIVELNDIYS